MSVQVIRSKTTRKSKLRVAAYCRVSTESEIQEGSIENQIEHYEELIKSNPNYEFVNVYYDFGISGYKEKRPGFQAMMKDARAGKIDLIITKSITRFARNTNTLLKATRELKSLGIGVFFELQNMNTLNEGGELLLTVYAAFAQGESETYRELAQMTFKRKFSEGRPEYQLRKTLGFDMTENNEIQIVPKEAEGVKQIFQWVKENYSTQTIVKMAAAKGITLKSGKQFTAQWVYKTVRNVAYKGDYIMQRTYTDSERKVHVNQTLVPSFYIENDHEAIVSKRLWEAANQVIDDRAKERTTHLEMKPLTEENYPYIHKLHCAKCGGVLHGQKTKSGAQYSFSCGRRNRQGKGFCSGVSVPQKVIESWGEIDGNIYISFDPDKPVHKQHSYVKESTWKKNHKKKKLPPMPTYNAENYPYYRRVCCAECGHLLTRSRRYDGSVEFVCNGMVSHGKSYCKGVRVPEEVLNRLPEWDGFYWIKEDKENGEKHYSYTCKEEKPQRKEYSAGSREN